MNEKQVHVKAYTRDDGTQVREHYRGFRGDDEFSSSKQAPSYYSGTVDENTPSETTLYGRISNLEDEPETPNPQDPTQQNIWSTISDLASFAFNMTQQAFNMTPHFVSPDNNKAGMSIYSQLKPFLDIITEAQKMSDANQENTLNDILKTKDKVYFNDLSKTYVEQKQFNNENKTALQRLTEAIKSNDPSYVSQELQNFQDLQKRILETTNQKIDTLKTGMDVKKAESEKSVIDMGGSLVLKHLLKSPDAAEMWKAASSDFKNSKEYIDKNGQIINSINTLEPNLQETIKTKLQTQLNVADAKGIFYNHDSNLSKEIAQSPEMQDFIYNNKDALKSGQHINGSTILTSSNNLHYAINRADIHNAHIDKHGNLNALVIDTYDFNKNDPDWKVQIARNAQDHNLITNYYTINHIKIPKENLKSLYSS